MRKNSRDESVVGVTPSNMGQTRIGLQGIEPLVGDWSAVFQAETFFNPQSGEIANSLKSLAVNNGVSLANQSVGVDGGSAGQAFQTAFVGLQSARFGALTFGRQVTLLSEGTIQYDPNYKASAFGLLGASNTYAGGGSSEDDRLDSTPKYRLKFNDLLHLGALYKFSNSNGNGAANTAVQANIGGSIAGASLDAYYSKVNSAITASSLSAVQVAGLPGLGYSVSNSLAASVRTTRPILSWGRTSLTPFKFFAGYMYIQYANPTRPLSAGFTDIGGYVLAFVNNTPYNEEKIVQVYWTGVRYSVIPNLDLTAAYYGYHQSAYGTGKQAAARLSRTAPAAEASTPFLSTPTTGSTSTSMLTWAPCTAACMTEQPAATSPRTTSIPRLACATSSDIAPFDRTAVHSSSEFRLLTKHTSAGGLRRRRRLQWVLGQIWRS